MSQYPLFLVAVSSCDFVKMFWNGQKILYDLFVHEIRLQLGGQPIKKAVDNFCFRGVGVRGPNVLLNVRHVSDRIFFGKYPTRLSLEVKIDSVFAINGF